MSASLGTASHVAETTGTTETTGLTSREKASAMLRQSDARDAKAEGNENMLWQSARSLISNVSLRYTRYKASIDLFEMDMHDLWHLYFQASMNISHDRVEQDRLILQIISARELGALTRRRGDILEEAATGNGVIWKDLPFLVEDFTQYWIEGNMSINERMNFASFLAKLCAAGITSEELCGCALIVLRDALETTRPEVNETTTEGSEGGHGQRATETLSILELLPIANMWIFKAGNKIIEMSRKSAHKFPENVGRLGEQARAEASLPENGGFSPQRWLFWYNRLESLEAGSASQELAMLARGIKNNMAVISLESESEMSRELGRRGLLPL